MSNLINELRDEHSLLIDSFSKIEHPDIASREASEQLQVIKSILLGHVRKENEELYSKLHELALSNLRLRYTLDLFTRDKAKLSAAVIEFLDKYSKGGSRLDFRRDFNRLFVVFSAYIRREEEIIFSEYLSIPHARTIH